MSKAHNAKKSAVEAHDSRYFVLTRHDDSEPWVLDHRSDGYTRERAAEYVDEFIAGNDDAGTLIVQGRILVRGALGPQK